MDLEPRLKSALSRVLCVCFLFCFVLFVFLFVSLQKKNYQINCPFFQEHGFNFFAMTYNVS